MRTAARYLSRAGAGALGVLSALHLSWAMGSTWPAPDEAGLARSVAGTAKMLSRSSCVAVGGGLGLAALAVAGVSGSRGPIRVVRTAIAVGFIVRGMAGVTGNTHRMLSWRPAPHFVDLDRRFYGPLCLVIGVAAAASVAQPAR